MLNFYKHNSFTFSRDTMINILRIVAITLLLTIGFAALAAGYSFMQDPSGKAINISTDYLRPAAPFSNYLVPGIVLFTMNGVLSILIAVMAVKKTASYPLLIFLQGCIYVGWITTQLTMVTAYHPLHTIVGLTGLVLIIIGSVAVQAVYKRDIREQYSRVNSLAVKYAYTSLGKIQYLDYGTGQPVLLVHGVMGGCDHGLHISKTFFGQGYRIIAISRFGYLGSPIPANSSPSNQADLCAALLDSLGITEAIVAGFSAGGPSALQLALRHQNRCGALILISMAVPPYNKPGRVSRWLMEKFFGSDFMFWFFLKYTPSMALKLMGTPYSVQKRLTSFETIWHKDLMWRLLPANLRVKGVLNDVLITNPDLNNSYPVQKIMVNTIVFHSKDDPMPPFEIAKNIAANIPNARFVEIESGGHLLVGHHDKVQKTIRGLVEQPKLWTVQSRVMGSTPISAANWKSGL